LATPHWPIAQSAAVGEGRSVGAPGTRSKHSRRAAALILSALLHVFFLLAVFATATGTAPLGAADSFGEGEAVEVMLAGREGVPARGGGAAAVAAPSALDQIARRVRADSELTAGPKEPARRPGDLASLLNSLGRIKAPGRRGEGADAAGASDKAGRDPRTASASRRGGATADVSAGELWGQVEPCWRRIGGRSTVPVMLEVTLDGLGGLAGPPRILRPDGGRPSEQRLLAEAQALEAIHACLPYRTAGLSGLGRRYRVGFGG
jgi:hypothetical protein